MNKNKKLDQLIEITSPQWVSRKVKSDQVIQEFLNMEYPGIPLKEQIFLYRRGMSCKPTCPICNNELRFQASGEYMETCSQKCSHKNPSRTSKIRSTMLSRYGVEHALQSKELFRKKDSTMQSRYGTKVALHNKKLLDKHSFSLKTRSREVEKHLILKSEEVHEKKYDYSKVKYTSSEEKVTIVCSIHGDFDQLLISHSKGHGCPRCAAEVNGNNKRSNTHEFIKKCKGIHDEKYDYSNVDYITAFDAVTITCPKHGRFVQRANDHLSGYGCPKCGKVISKYEEEIVKFLKNINVNVKTRVRDIIPPKEIDIFIPEFNIGIEFCGTYWHSDAVNTDRMHILHKHRLCERQGIRLLTIFEDEWTLHKNKVRDTIRHLVGKSKKGHYARKTTIKEISWKEAMNFLDQYHLLGAGTPSKFRIGAFHENEMIAVMIFGVPSNEQGITKEMEMKRFVTDKRNHPGIASKMFKWAITHYGFKKVIAFVDRRWFTGKFKTDLGFRVIGETEPSLWWTRRGIRFHRRFTTKQKLLESSYGFNKSMTKIQMLKSLGYHRIWDCGKIKLEWSEKIEK